MAELSKVNVNSTDYDLKDQKSRDALVDVVDNGAKNFAKTTTVSFTTSMQIELSPITGTVVLSARNIASDDASASQCAAVFKYSDGTSSEKILINRGDNVSAEKTLGKTATMVTIYASDTADHSTGKTATFTDLMICTKAEWDISQAYVPYCKTNAELTNDTSTLFTENTRQETEIGVVANAGAKNLLPMTHTNGSITRYGVTCAWDSNSGTMTLNGAHRSGDSAAIFEFYDGSAEDTKILPAGSYVLTGCPAGGSTSSYRAVLSQITGAVDIGNGVNFELSEPHYAAYRILISGNVTFNNMVFKPMIRPAAITDPTFQPFARTNRELTVLTDEDRASLIELVDGGAKNVRNITLDELKTLGGNSQFSWSGNVATKNNVSFTINTDGTITVNAAQAASEQVILDIYRMPSDASDMVLSGAPAGGDADSYFQYVKGTTFRDYGEGVIYSKTGAHSIGLVIASGYQPQNLTFKPMICTEAAWKISKSFQPYRPSYQELSDDVDSLKNGSFVGIELKSGDDLNNLSRGRYYCRSATVSAGILNNPNTGSGFVLDHMYNVGNVVQLIYPSSSSNTIFYKRSYASSSWRPWCKFEGTEVT